MNRFEKPRLKDFPSTLSGRFLILTVAFVFMAEILILIPSISKYRMDYITTRLEKAQIASLVGLTAKNGLDEWSKNEILSNSGVFEVTLERDSATIFSISRTAPAAEMKAIDLRKQTAWVMMSDAIGILLESENHVIRVTGVPVQSAGLSISILIESNDLRSEMLNYGTRILMLSAFITILAASLLFMASRHILVLPIQNLVRHMVSYAKAPEDGRRIIRPGPNVIEIMAAERALHEMQTQLTASLRQKDRLAQLGGAVAKISHDLRNILTSAQLFADRMEGSHDPLVARIAPKLIGSITRAINLCETTLAFGKAQEASPRMMRIEARRLLEEVIESEGIDAKTGSLAGLTVRIACDEKLLLRADPDHMYRVLSNMVRNAKQAMEQSGSTGEILLSAGETDKDWWITVSDSGPGLPKLALENLFSAFHGSVKKGGTGLGLSIANELVRGHGGEITLKKSDESGTVFRISLPKSVSMGGLAA